MRMSHGLSLLCFVLLASPASAEMCVVDVVPAATLLVPYFEVDRGNSSGVTTLFSINNAASEPALAHLIFWTDWGFPTIDFDVFLTGYDVVTVNLRDVFSGNIPITADEQSDPGDLISPHGAPEWDGSFPYCQLFFPLFSNPVITGTAFSRLVYGHLGHLVPQLGNCVGADHGDNVARGYITIDSVSRCSLVLDPGDSSYFVNGGTGVANNKNVLWGDYHYIDPANQSMASFPLVHIEADSRLNGTSTPTGYTFYGTYLRDGIGTGRDNREPLGGTWGARYLNGGAVSKTDFVVWRDSTSLSLWTYPCGTSPEWFPIRETEVVCFDESEDSVQLCSGAGNPACFPLATQRVPSSGLGMPFDFGWCRMNLNHTCSGCYGGGFGPEYDVAQSYVAVLHKTPGLYAGGLPAVELATACDLSLPFPWIFFDDFESGDTSAWSSAGPF